MRLIDALRINSSTRLSFVGSGGKTTALIRLAQEWPSIALLAATAHIGKNQIDSIKKHFIWMPDHDHQISRLNTTSIITGPAYDQNRLEGIDTMLWDDLENLANQQNVPLFIESDGSKMKPVKAPARHEPPIPPWVNHVVVSVGLSAVGKELNEQNIHRAEIFSSITGLEMEKPVSLQSITKMLIHPEGGLKNIPEKARKTILLNQVDFINNRSDLASIEEEVLGHFDSVIIASLKPTHENQKESSLNSEVIKVAEKVAGIILAAGNSRRMGAPKALLTWHGIPFVRICAMSAINAGLSPIVIIAGHEFENIQEAVKGLPVQVIQNIAWNEGQASSVRKGIESLPGETGGAIFLLVDQPQIPVPLIRRLVNEHALTLAPVIFPQTGGRRANPVLFDRITFNALSVLEGDIGGRKVFSQFQTRSIPWLDESILLDVDTPEDYAKLMELTDD